MDKIVQTEQDEMLREYRSFNEPQDWNPRGSWQKVERKIPNGEGRRHAGCAGRVDLLVWIVGRIFDMPSLNFSTEKN
jgi:hypothetical protein